MLHALISLAHCPQAQKQLRALAHTLAQMLAQNTRSLRCLLKTLARSEHLLKTLVRSEHLLTRSLRCLLRTLARSDACSKHSLAQMLAQNTRLLRCLLRTLARSDACSEHSLAQMLAQNTRSLRALAQNTRLLRALAHTLAQMLAQITRSLPTSKMLGCAVLMCAHFPPLANDCVRSLCPHAQAAACSYMCLLPTPSERPCPLILPACAGCSMFLCILTSHP